ncbi:bifunctional diguanylate cyclase/phosphodiesterase [Pseudoxanthomonas sp.]|uniref:putative bifunctional diguanylate cyclase/phosphodiesterase n=1 Tax=Pseudoxanthomonas sp. TaxID=1871049 RepID=UPI0025843DD1|nr:bifunctional diguanylate cyclase/phosphodiesterase [Pseudoxanthomonas sp.]MCR6685239.1 EAL domain-containing protein [Pseudoxanthomonas sp.]
MSGSYNNFLVLCSLLIAILASYTALHMAGHVAAAGQRAGRWWLAGGACAMGLGIWSMHFVGMLAFRLPIALGYDLGITLGSLLAAVATSAFALWLATRERMPWQAWAGGSLLMGCGIALMHYMGMAALRMQPSIDYHPGWFLASILVAVAASAAALWIAFRLRGEKRRHYFARAAAAVIMGLAVVGMHYTGMAAARFAPGAMCGAAGARALPADWLAVLVIVTTVAILGITLVVSVLDRQLQVRTSRLAASLAQANSELVQAALHDPLTRLPNRMLLRDRMEHAIEASAGSGQPFAVLFMDLDGFKAVNDAYGHQKGDALLVETGRRVRAVLRSQDTLARLGGDEFVLLAHVDGPSDAAVLAETIIEAVSVPVQIDGLELAVSTSIGIAMHPADGADERELMAHADAAMYHAKDAGRNGYAFFAPSMNSATHRQLSLLGDLRHAIERDQLLLHYQPKFQAGDGGGPPRLAGAEALLRWRHPLRGVLAPDAFIALAERSGLIVAIGDWVLDQACAQLRRWHDAGHGDWTIAVNLSPAQFAAPSLLPTVEAALRRHGIPAGKLTLEITENMAMRNVEVSLAILHELAALGVKISIDDFGTGYSSLLYLKRLPATELKIDRGFVRDLEHDSDDAAIVSSIVALGRALDLQVVAEGVETDGQQRHLSELGCDYLQGYLLGRPVTAERFLESALALPHAGGPGPGWPRRAAGGR